LIEKRIFIRFFLRKEKKGRC